ncbi:hypothetical protein, partial [uncultured Bosea sp.]|uniref:hypothetical protein n=1 Tax=uncultured Bosea sp. TaxID=211457 RepID=UPI00344DB457
MLGQIETGKSNPTFSAKATPSSSGRTCRMSVATWPAAPQPSISSRHTGTSF